MSNLRPTQHVYRKGSVYERCAPPCDQADPVAFKMPTIADSVPATWIMSRDVICAHEDLTIDVLLDLVVQRRIGCVPVVDGDGHPIGMITKLDLVDQAFAAKDPDQPTTAITAGQLMLPFALTLDEHATVAHVAAMMALEDVHHLPIVANNGMLMGIVSSLDVVRWLAANDGYFGTTPAPRSE